MQYYSVADLVHSGCFHASMNSCEELTIAMHEACRM